MQPPKFSICVICRNGAKTLPRLAKSIEPFLSRGGEWVVCDTGSTDGSVDVARSLGAKVTEVGERFIRTIDADLAGGINARFVVFGEEPIVQAGSRLFDFAKARNFTASLALNDWACWADSDEAFVNLDIDKLNEATSDPDALHLAYDFCYAWKCQMNPGEFGYPGDPAVLFTQSKMHRHRDGVREDGSSTGHMEWRGIVHEVLAPVGVPGRKLGRGDVAIPKMESNAHNGGLQE